MKRIPLVQRISLAPVLLFAALCLSGCPGIGNMPLDPTGPSRGDAITYNFQLAVNTQHAILQTFLNWERDNAAFLTNAPQVHALAEKIRTEGPDWFTAADTRFAEYKVLRDAVNVDGPALARARSALLAAMQIITTHKNEAIATMGSVPLAP